MLNNQESRSQDIAQDLFLFGGQTGGELDIDSYDEITAVARLLGDYHAQAGEAFLVAGLCWTGLADADRFAVNCAHDTFPACQGFLKCECHFCDEVVANTFEIGVWEL